ncbi:tail fiber assembly protein [Yersinia alsatica]|uniref:tail fiber assembly protein n=1 Tax=Yersinia alsatica TaxID=2890317 RepID=UPI0032EF89C3
MKIYSESGSHIEYIVYTEAFHMPDSCIEMTGPRPSPSYYASEHGEWLPGPSPVLKQHMVTEAIAEQVMLVREASNKIETLKDRIDAGQERTEELNTWKAYRIALDDIDINKAPDIEWPNRP